MSDINETWLEACLERLIEVRVGVFGDFCIDAYWLIDENESELSVETSLPVRRVRQQRYSLGGAANVVANLAALGVKQIRAAGLIGDDLYGELMLRKMGELGVNTQGMLNSQDDWQTFVFMKPCIGDVEQNRIDIGGFNEPSADSISALTEQLDKLAANCDIVILNQQIPAGMSTPAMIEKINTVITKHPECKFIVDSRLRAKLYKGAMLKVNAHEAAYFLGEDRPLDERITADEAKKYAAELFTATSRPAFVTRGENGLVVADSNGVHEIHGIQIIDRIDTVGAGDATIAAITAAIGSGCNCHDAAKLANIAASIVVRKLQITGTANPDEISTVGPNPDYVYHPELADDPRRANYIKGTEIEIIRQMPENLNIRHAIFDHDGTISTLREGWEHIMEPMMVRAILGPRYEDADEVLYHKVIDTSRAFIDKTTGIQTLVQMQGLIKLVHQFECVPKDEILDMHGYKAVYNKELLKMVQQRVDKLKCGELNTEDFLLKNAQLLLEKLHAAGVKLYLASGTDETDVIAEAKAMGYADLFEGRIFGAVGDIKVEAKRIVMERIIREHNLSGSEFVTFGDGPVEVREARKRGGIAVGIASDEIRRFGLNPTKRARLIRAGADIIVSDFCQINRLLAELKL